MEDRFQLQTEQFWERLLRTERSLANRLLIATSIAALGFLLISLLYFKTGIYYSMVTIFATAFVTLYGGLITGLSLTFILVLAADYYFIPPTGSVLDNGESIIHFLIVVGFGFIMSFLSASLRVSFCRTLLAKKEAEAAKNELEKAIQARDEMVGIISHELKNPLTALQTGTMLIQRMLPPDPQLKNVLTLVERLMPSVQRMNHLISDLLDVTRLEAKALRMELRVCDLLEVVQEVVKSQEASAQVKLVELKSVIPAECQHA